MATLADINKSLSRQETVLDRVEDNTYSTQKGINNFLKFLEKQKYKDLEAQREMGKVARPGGPGGAAAGGGAAPGGGFKLPGMSGLGLAGIGGLAAAVGSGLIRRGLPSLLLYSFADEIVDHFFPDESELSDAQKEMKNMLEGGLKGGALGFLLGKRFAVIGAVVGALSQNETVRTEFGKLVDRLEELGFSMDLLQGFATSFVTTVGEGLTGFNKLLDGEFDFSLLDEMLLTMGSIALILAPGKMFGGAMTLAGRLFNFNRDMRAGSTKFKGRGRLGMLTAVAAALGLGYMAFGMDDGGEDGGIDVIDTAMTAAGGYAMSSVGTGMVQQMEADKFARQQKAMNFQRTSGTGAVMSKAGNMMKPGVDGKATTIPADPADMGKPKKFWFEKYPKLAKMFSASKGALRGLGFLNAFFGWLAYKEAQDIWNDPTLSEDQKMEAIGAIVGRELGAIGLSAVGAAIGTVVGGPVGLLVGGGIGGVAGALGGEYAGGQLMKFLTGKSIEKDEFQKAYEQADRNVISSYQSAKRVASAGIIQNINDPMYLENALAQLDASGISGTQREQLEADIVSASQIGRLKSIRASLPGGESGYASMWDASRVQMMRDLPPIVVQDNSNNSSNGYNAYSMHQSGASTQDVVDAWVEGNRSSPR